MNAGVIDPVKAREALELASIVWPRRPLKIAAGGNPAWYLAHIVGIADERAKEWLERNKVKFYYPQLRDLKPVPRKRLSLAARALGVPIMRPILIPLFPRYIFVWLDLASVDWFSQFQVAGLAGIACNEYGLPYKVSGELIDQVRAREIDGAVPGSTPLWEILKIGDRIKINSGPFENHEGAVEAIRQLPATEFDSGTRIRVVVALFGRPASLDLLVDQVEPLPADKAD